MGVSFNHTRWCSARVLPRAVVFSSETNLLMQRGNYDCAEIRVGGEFGIRVHAVDICAQMLVDGRGCGSGDESMTRND